MNQSEPQPMNGVQIYCDGVLPTAKVAGRWHWRIFWNGKVVGQSAVEDGYESKAEAYQDFMAATNAIDLRLGKRTWRNAHAVPEAISARI